MTTQIEARESLAHLTDEEQTLLARRDPEAWKRLMDLAISAGLSAQLKERFKLGVRGVNPWRVGVLPGEQLAPQVVAFVTGSVAIH